MREEREGGGQGAEAEGGDICRGGGASAELELACIIWTIGSVVHCS